MAKTKKCMDCGTFNEQDSKFCEKCGNSLNQNDTTKPQESTVNMIDCPFCGQKIPMNSEKCSHCGEWLDPSKDNPHGVSIVLGYIISIFGWLGLIPAIYLLTRVSSSAKKHGVIQLVLSIIFGFLGLFVNFY
ncbi:double zinc ribbon [Methanobrevibacter cuticularis]|uniref:Double zinc ribbon n=1 Tax=Methanobrevibacter cuticularis TaxID=47311 RepID=A0A166EJF9_9EURY|nr:zinc ribbon domain-containing protein [Methanobrevibacter cuticularis]KZX16722.1 double zinc ribbon [Methanobrevibacter cuticularis]